MKKIVTFILCFLFSICALAQKEDIKAIKTVYDTYEKATDKGLADEAFDCLSSISVAYYSNLLDLCKTADSVKLVSQPIMDLLTVLTIKARVDSEQLCSMNSGKDLLINALRYGMVGKIPSLGDISVQGDTAYAEVKTSPMQYRFIREAASWKLDLVYTFSAVTQSLEAVAKQYGLTNQQICLQGLQRLDLPDYDILWVPACK